MVALTLGGVLLAVAAVCWWDGRPEAAWSRDVPAVTDRIAKIAHRSARSSSAVSPLIAQAQAFADHLNPPRSPEPSPALQDPPAISETKTVAPAAMLRLHATSCYPDRPERSMALVSAPGGTTPEQQWVKEGSQFGPFHIHEIRRGGIIYREGNLLREVAIEAGVERPSLVRDTRIGFRHVSAAIDDAVRPLAGLTDSNDIGITGN